jgi:uncharacterized membrane protein YeaQ/YmgE (transglycosylase-associated protein family)
MLFAEVVMDGEALKFAQQMAHDVLAWVGFGTLVGLLAKAIMPGKDPGGAVATLAMGIGGTVMGLGTLAFFYEGGRQITPISPIGFVVATAGAFLILFFYKLLGGYWFVEGEGPVKRRPTRVAPRRRAAVVYEDD